MKLKRVLTLCILLFVGALMLRAGTKPGVIQDPTQYRDTTISPRRSCTITSTIEVPAAVLQDFYDSFIVDSENNFLGAMIDDIRNYITWSEILTLIEDQGYEVDPWKVIDKHKPRFSQVGCIYNEKWLCQYKEPN